MPRAKRLAFEPGEDLSQWLESHSQNTKRFMSDIIRTALDEYRWSIEAKKRGDFRQSPPEKDFLYESKRTYPWQTQPN